VVAAVRKTDLSVAHAREQRAWVVLGEVLDPEIPVLSIVDLGIVRWVRTGSDGALEVGLSPTYSGCPATEVIRASVEAALTHGDMEHHRIVEQLAPPWTSDWISDAGREKLHAYGIAPPTRAVAKPKQLFSRVPPTCPRCGSLNTQLTSEFGSTPCKSLHKCLACLEPFDHFKCI